MLVAKNFELVISCQVVQKCDKFVKVTSLIRITWQGWKGKCQAFTFGIL